MNAVKISERNAGILHAEIVSVYVLQTFSLLFLIQMFRRL
jgi:hypothetical protein